MFKSMSTSSSNICQNCNAKNELPFKFCSNCGQKNTDGKITFSELWSEFQDAVFNIESRTWRTFKNLFIPGRLTLEYFSGKHRRYVHPLRLLLVTSIIVIIAMSFQDFQSATNHGFNIKERIVKNYERQRLYGILFKIADSTNVAFPEQETEIITDTILSAFKDSLLTILYKQKYGDKYRDTIDLNRYISFGSDVGFGSAAKVSKHDFLHMSEDELVATYKNDAGIFERLVFRQKVKYVNDESQLSAAVISHSTWAILLLMPCLALVLYLLNIRNSYYYIEHLIFTFHIHAFSFLVLALFIMGWNTFPRWTFLIFILIIWMYIFISMWKVYGQSVSKTIIKFLILSASYAGLFFLFLYGTVILTFLLL